MSVLVRAKTIFHVYCIAAWETKLFVKNDGLTIFPNKHIEKSRTYHGLLHVLVREKTVYFQACSVEGNYNFDSDEILWLLDSQALMQSFL